MAVETRIPGLVDIVRSDRPEEIAALAGDLALDRRFVVEGPLVNRLVVGNLNAVLKIGERALPTASGRDDAERAAEQASLRESLDAATATPFNPAALSPLVAAVRAEVGAPPLELAVQEAVGRCFAPDYRATDESWRAAKVLDTAAHTPNPFAMAFGGAQKLDQARETLSVKVNRSPPGVHATGLAVHTMLRSFERLRELLKDRERCSRLTAEAAVAQCLAGPKAVLRQARSVGTAAGASYKEGTLVMLELDAARRRDPGPAMTFLAGTWAECPASRWAPALLRAVYELALAAHAPTDTL